LSFILVLTYAGIFVFVVVFV